MANKVPLFPTSAENIALDLIFDWLGEERCNRTMDEYRSIAKRLPKPARVFPVAPSMRYASGPTGKTVSTPNGICEMPREVGKALSRQPLIAIT